MIYIGIDQSYSSTGISVINDEGFLINSYTIQPGIGMSVDAMYSVVSGVEDATHKARCDDVVIAIEGNSVAASNSTTARRLAELAGAIKYAMYPIPVCEVHMSSWKSKIANNRLRGVKKNTKSGSAEYLKIMLDVTGYTFETTDEADAYCIALYSLLYMEDK